MEFRMIKCPTPILGFAAYSGTGKTTLLEKLLPILNEGGVRIAVLKHAHHQFDIDQPGKDSYRLRHAGAQQMLIASAQRWALMTENTLAAEPRLEELLPHLDHKKLDLVLVEGFKQESFSKIELHRPSTGKTTIYPTDSNIIAVATDEPDKLATQLPILDINNVVEIANFIRDRFLSPNEA